MAKHRPHIGLHMMITAYLLAGPERCRIETASEFAIHPEAAGIYINEMVRQKLMVSIGRGRRRLGHSHQGERFLPVNSLQSNPLLKEKRNECTQAKQESTVLG